MARQDVQRSALLIGVVEHDVVRPNLPVVRNDLRIMQKALESSRFTVQQIGVGGKESPTRSTIRRRIRRFCADAGENSTILLYFSGHGVHYNNRDYLIPSDATLEDHINVEEYLVPIDLSFVLDKCKAQTVIFFVDACREGIEIMDSAKGLMKGLTFDAWSEGDVHIATARESAIVFSCGPGALSWFAEGDEYSLFTKALAEVLDVTHPARKFREVTESLQNRLSELAKQHNRANQTVRVCAEFDQGYTLLDRNICEGPEPPTGYVEPSDVRATAEPRQPVIASSFIDRLDEQRSQSIYGSVLFADLCGSTGYKLYHHEDQAVRKAVLHNKVAGDVIRGKGGSVVKYVADRVMAVFEGDRCEERAVSAGIAIIRRLEQENAERGLHFPHDLKTSVGIKSGRFWKVRFDGCGVEDYVGLTADLAARLCSLAGLGQVICDDDTFETIQFPDRDWTYSRRVERFIEGVDNPLPVRLVVPKGYPSEPEAIPLSGFTRPIPVATRVKLENARRLFREKQHEEALALCSEVLQSDGGNFEAHVCCAEILLEREAGRREDRFHALERIIKDHLCIAKQIRPQANRVWRLLGWAYYLEATTAHETADKMLLLSTAFERAKLALKCAEDYMDENGEARAKVLLALILREQGRFDQSRNAEYLAKANEYCAEIERQLVGFLDRTRSDHLLAHALIQRSLGAPIEAVEKILEDARKADHRNPRVHEALAEFCWTRG